MERDFYASGLTNEQLNFNSHAHVERDHFNGIYGKGTENFNSHAHVERDSMPLARLCCLDYFNSHAHVERDTENLENVVDMGISTHTLTWSVTPSYLSEYQGLLFQLTRSRGA